MKTSLQSPQQSPAFKIFIEESIPLIVSSALKMKKLLSQKICQAPMIVDESEFFVCLPQYNINRGEKDISQSFCQVP